MMWASTSRDTRADDRATEAKICTAAALVLCIVVAAACGPAEELDAGSDGGLAPRDSGVDTGLGTDTGVTPPRCSSAPARGLLGGECSVTGTCAAADCFVHESASWELLSGAPDPAHEEECVAGGTVIVPVGFGNLCSRACDTSAPVDGCGECNACNDAMGGFARLPFRVTFYLIPSVSEPGICRARCTFDPTGATNGGCRTGYTCDARTSTCFEACRADEQCNLEPCPSRHAYDVWRVEGPLTCDRANGRCEWTARPTASVGSPCEQDADCPADVGWCRRDGTCSAFQCDLPDPADPTGATLAFPCGDGARCVSLDSHSAAFCVQTCSTHEDCPPHQSCRTDLLPSMDGVCWGFCESDSQCRTNDRCDLRAGVCKPFCDPEGAGLPDAIACAADEACAPVGGAAHGFCEPLGRLCGTDEECHGSQACEVLADDRLGRCVDGCLADADCTGSGAGCKVQPGSSFGVCRAPGGACSPGSGFDARGDAQCLDSQRCSTTVAYELGTCVNR